MEIRALLYATLSGTLYGFLGYLGTQLIAENLSISNVLFWRFLIATLWMLAWDWCKQEKFFEHVANLRSSYFPLVISAACYVGTSAFYFLASEKTGTGIAMVIFFAYPVFVAVFAWAQNNWQISKYSVAGLVAVIIGLMMLKGGNNVEAVSLLGITFAIVSAGLYGVYVFKTKPLAKKMLSSHFTIVICLGCTLVSLISTLATQSFAIPTSFTSWFYLLAFGVVATALPIQLLSEALKYISALKASILSVLEPVVTLLVGIVLLHESISSLQTLGIFVVLIAAISIQFVKE